MPEINYIVGATTVVAPSPVQHPGLPSVVMLDQMYDFDTDINPFKKVIKEETGTNWLEKKVRQVFNLGAPPKPDPEYVEKFIASQKLKLINPEFPFEDTKTLVGIEVEVENVTYINPNIPLCFWMIEEDGSLRNHGQEFKTLAIPTSHVQLALEQLFGGLNPDVDFSNRTSIHVHLNVQGLSIKQLLTLMFTYSVVENLLFKFAGANRRNSIFCVPITETRLFADLNISKSKYLRSHLTETWQKYSALNMIPISTFGTVEFRQMPGTRDVTKLCIWIDLLSRIRLFAYRNSLESVMQTIGELNTNSQYRRFIDQVFGNLAVYLDLTSLLPDMEKAVYIVKNCTATNEFHQKALAKLDPNSMLALRLGQQVNIAQILGGYYPAFVSLRKTVTASDVDFYLYIRDNIKEYLRVYGANEEIKHMLLIIRDTPI